MSVATAQPTADSFDPPAATPAWADFAEALCAALGLRCELRGRGAAVFGPEPAEAAGRSDSARRWPGPRLGRKRQAPKPPPVAEPLVEADSAESLVGWLGEWAIRENRLPEFAPVGDPQAVHEISQRLFSAYQIDGGAIHLGGCHLEPTPIIRLSRVGKTEGDAVRHRYFDASGEELTSELVRELGLEHVASRPHGDGAVDRQPWRPAIAAAVGSSKAENHAALVASLVMVNDARGQLLVEIGEESVAVAFGGWARTLAAPAARCPQTGEETFHLAATSDGRIAAAEQIVTCEATGDRLLADETAVCTVTGKRVASVRCVPCSVTGEPTLREGMATCPRCNQEVSRVVLEGDGCRGCRRLKRVPDSDPRVAMLKAAAGEHVTLGRWRINETHNAWIAEVGGWLRRELVVVSKRSETLEYAAERRIPFGAWQPTCMLLVTPEDAADA
ncbi:MAG: hypothetical protein AAGJ46_19545 [Planctomycetota bacterium]